MVIEGFGSGNIGSGLASGIQPFANKTGFRVVVARCDRVTLERMCSQGHACTWGHEVYTHEHRASALAQGHHQRHHNKTTAACRKPSSGMTVADYGCGGCLGSLLEYGMLQALNLRAFQARIVLMHALITRNRK